jgi:anti-sigma factor RsiW
MNRFDGDDRLHALIDGEVASDLKSELDALLAMDPKLRGRFDEHRRHKEALADAADALVAEATPSAKTEQLASRLRFSLWTAGALRGAGKALAACALIAEIGRAHV